MDKDPKKAVEMYEMAANQDHGGALFNLGVCYMQGDGEKALMKCV